MPQPGLNEGDASHRIITEISRPALPNWPGGVSSNNCIGCHTINGEGAYFAPELDNVYVRRGPDFIKTWIRIQPTGVPGRRQMPHFNFSDQDLNDIVAYLQWLSHVNTNHWPPNTQG